MGKDAAKGENNIEKGVRHFFRNDGQKLQKSLKQILNIESAKRDLKKDNRVKGKKNNQERGKGAGHFLFKNVGKVGGGKFPSVLLNSCC